MKKHAHATEAHTLIFDLEDGCRQKEMSRTLLEKELPLLREARPDVTIAVRVNSFRTEEYINDMSLIRKLPECVDVVMLSKAGEVYGPAEIRDALPEAQLDRFMFKIELGYLSEDDEVIVVSQTTQHHDRALSHPLSGEDILDFQRIARQVPAAEAVIKYAVRLVHASRPQSESAPEFVKDWVSWGAGIRASQNLILAGKVRALLLGRYNVSFSDVRALAPSVFRHRILLNFHAEAERITTDEVIRRLLEAVPEPSSEI